MKITKFGHSSLLIEEGGRRIMIDPGKFFTSSNDLRNIDLVVVTHGHFDHFDIGILKNILKNNPTAEIVTNTEVGAILEGEGIAFTKVEDGGRTVAKGLAIEGFGNEHIIFGNGFGKCQNTGYFINNKFFYPGDAYVDPGKPVAVLGMPVGGPWLDKGEAMEYLIKIRPEICVPVHDGIGSDTTAAVEFSKIIPEKTKIKFVFLPIGKEVEIN
jgi:L-ascorbate metabolism protein UlaG (beta-lactamase superfamily)